MILRNSTLLCAAVSFWIAFAGAARSEMADITKAVVVETNPVSAQVTTDELRRIVQDGSAVIIDARTAAQFDAGHIPNAKLVAGSGDSRLAGIHQLTQGSKSAPLVLYCNGPNCQASRRFAASLKNAGYTNVRRYQLGTPVWRALGGPIVVETDGVARIYGHDQTAVFVDARPAADFAKGSIAGALNAPADDVASGKLKKLPFPEDDFNRRIVLFGGDGNDARKLAESMTKRAWHNVAYYPGRYEELSAALKQK